MSCSLATLPNELILQVVQDLNDLDLSYLLRCAHWTQELLQPVLNHRSSLPYDGRSCLQWAVSYSHIGLLERLLMSGIHPDTVVSPVGRYPLYVSVLCENLPMAKLLLAHGADPNKISFHDDGAGDTALHQAALRNDQPMIRLLAENGADMSIKPMPIRCSRTPLHDAVYGGYLETVETLLELGARVGEKDGQDLTPLEVVRWGFKYQCDFNLQDLDEMVGIGKTLLRAGAEMWDIDGLEFTEGPEWEKLWYEFQLVMHEYREEYRAIFSSSPPGDGAMAAAVAEL